MNGRGRVCFLSRSAQPPDGVPEGVVFYVHSDDVAGSLSQAEQLGGHAIAGPMDMPDGHKRALLADPEGHVVGLCGTG